jgi:DNA-binding MarR family transcriptional regulator
MNLPAAVDARAERVEHVVTELLPNASLLTRLLSKQAPSDVTRSEGSVLRMIEDSPRRITDLAELEGLAQPTMTVLVKRLEARGWVQRERQADDGRVALISLTPAGRDALEEFRARYRALLRAHIGGMPDEQVAALETATEALADLVGALQHGGAN